MHAWKRNDGEKRKEIKKRKVKPGKENQKREGEKTGAKKESEKQNQNPGAENQKRKKRADGALWKNRSRKPAGEKSGRRKQQAEIPEDTKRLKSA